MKRDSFRDGIFRKYLDKKAEGLSMNVIIVAVLGIIVLVVLVVIFVSRTDKAQDVFDSCLGGSVCVASKDACVNTEDQPGIIVEQANTCDKSGGKYCCRVFGKLKES